MDKHEDIEVTDEGSISPEVMKDFRKLNDRLRDTSMPLSERRELVETMFEAKLEGNMAVYCRNNLIAGVVERALGFLSPLILRRVMRELLPVIPRFIQHVQASHIIQTCLLLLPRCATADTVAASELDDHFAVAQAWSDQLPGLCAAWPRLAHSAIAAKVMRTWMYVACGVVDDAQRRFVAADVLARGTADDASAAPQADQRGATLLLTSFGTYIGNPRNRLIVNVVAEPAGASLVKGFFTLVARPDVAAVLEPADAEAAGDSAVSAACALFGLSEPYQPLSKAKNTFRILSTPGFAIAAEGALQALPRTTAGALARQVAEFTTQQPPRVAFEHPKMPCLSSPAARALVCAAIRRADAASYTRVTAIAAANFDTLFSIRGFGVLCALFETAGELERRGELRVPVGPLAPAAAAAPEHQAAFAADRLVKRVYKAAGIRHQGDNVHLVRRVCGIVPGKGGVAAPPGAPAVASNPEWLPELRPEHPGRGGRGGRRGGRAAEPEVETPTARGARATEAGRAAGYAICTAMLRGLPSRLAAPVGLSVAGLAAGRFDAPLLRMATHPTGGALLCAFFKSGTVAAEAKIRFWRVLKKQATNLALTTPGSFVIESAFTALDKDEASELLAALRRTSQQLSRTPSGRSLWYKLRGAEFSVGRTAWWAAVQADRAAARRKKNLAKALGKADAAQTDMASTALARAAPAVVPDANAESASESEPEFELDGDAPAAGAARAAPSDAESESEDEPKPKKKKKDKKKKDKEGKKSKKSKKSKH